MIETIKTIATHNGTFTITSVKSGDHRTFRVKTQKPDANFAPGSRIISLLTGPCNESDYRGFGFVNDNGQIYLWRNKQTPTFKAYANMLENMAQHIEAGNIDVQAATKCRVCNRKLTDPVSIETGIGPVCAGR
jgi:hypothetical protein